MSESVESGRPLIRLLISDLDGTLLTPDGEVTEASRRAVRRLHDEGIGFTVVSSRPPRGMQFVSEATDLRLPFAAFNGGMIVQPDLAVIDSFPLPTERVEALIPLLKQQGVDVWLYSGLDWFVEDLHGPHVEAASKSVRFHPKLWSESHPLPKEIVKVVGYSADHERISECERKVLGLCADEVSASRSKPYYLDLTSPQANKGAAVRQLSQLAHIPPDHVATIGDGPNDVEMFGVSDLSVAMGNATEEVKRSARYVTAPNDGEGFAEAVERFILPKGRGETDPRG